MINLFHIINGQLEMSRFEGGYFDAEGKPHYYLTDYQGNVVRVIDETGLGGQPMDYYPYGEPWVEWDWARADTNSYMIKNRFLYGGKERITQFGLGLYNFEARMYRAPWGRFSTPDKKDIDTPWLSPFAYCANNPVNLTDPTGMEIRGVRKQDAQMIVEDFRAMFPGEEFDNFRNLIVQSGKKQNGKSLAQISGEALSSAFNGITLNEDQQALVDMVVNTINSNDVHMVEYQKIKGVLSYEGEKVHMDAFMNDAIASHMPEILERNGGLPVKLLMGNSSVGTTIHTKRGSHSVIVMDQPHEFGRAVTTGHEILGHGRSWSAGFKEDHQHVQAIRTENMIRRVMGIPVMRNGIDHGPKTIVESPSLLPAFR